MLTSFGRELIDVTNPGNDLEGVVPNARPWGNSNVTRFRKIIEYALAVPLLEFYRPDTATTIPGKILYVPAGRYRIESQIPVEWRVNLWDGRGPEAAVTWGAWRNGNPFAASLRFPEELTLWMAPGAVFVPDPGCIIHIASSLVCEATRIFELPDTGGREPDRLVVFGRRTPKVLPEWWGAEPGQDSSEAIQHAIDAAIHHRVNKWEVPASQDPLRRGGPPYKYTTGSVAYPPIPIELRGNYQLSRPIEVRAGDRVTSLLRIIGERGILNAGGLDVFLAKRVDGAPVPRQIVEVFPDDRTLYFTSITALTPGAEEQVPVVRGVELSPGVRSGRRLEVLAGRSVGEFHFRLTLNRGGPLSFRVVIERVARMARQVLVIASTTMGGVWQGREAQGARLAAASPFAGTALLRLTEAAGFTLRNVVLDVMGVTGSSCLDVLPQQGMAAGDCEFRGKSTTLVHLGEREALLPTPRGEARVAIASNYRKDATGLSFVGCSWVVDGGGVGIEVRAGNTVPCEFRDCSFVGHAAAMIRASAGTFLADRCFFHNRGYTPPTKEVPAGFEPPDGADVFLTYQARTEVFPDPEGVVYPSAESHGAAAGLTMSACVSRSQLLLSAPSTRGGPSITASADWPTVLLNTRHLPEAGTADDFSVRWGLRGRPPASMVMLRDLANTRLGIQLPLVIVGGQYGGRLRVHSHATPCAFVGPRDLRDGLMRVNLEYDFRGTIGYTAVFCLAVDQVYSVR